MNVKNMEGYWDKKEDQKFPQSHSINKKNQGNKEEMIFIGEKERKSIKNKEKGDRIAKKHKETERLQTEK